MGIANCNPAGEMDLFPLIPSPTYTHYLDFFYTRYLTSQNPDGDGDPFVARIEAMLQYPGETPVVRVQWMYRARDTGTCMHVYIFVEKSRTHFSLNFTAQQKRV